MEHAHSHHDRKPPFAGRRGVRATGRALAVAVACLFAPLPAPALPKLQVPMTPGVDFQLDDGYCAPLPIGPQLQVVPILRGYPVVGFTMEVDVHFAKFLMRGCSALPDTYYPIPSSAWALVVPPGSGATLDLTNPLAPRLRLDAEGTFVARFIACPDGCTIGSRYQVEPQSVEVRIDALTSIPLGPESIPLPPPQLPVARTVQTRNNCGFGAGAAGPQWYVAGRQIEGPQDYRLLEGVVNDSLVSRKDSPLNHYTQDANFIVEPDPSFQDLLFVEGEDDIEVEWETGVIPDRYRPSPGDRLSVFGHWIYDCAHSTKTEIHPPVGVAVHRHRPILIPSDVRFAEFGGEGVGSNVYVPGIMTDMFFSTERSQMLNCSVDTGLRNAETQPGPNNTPIPTCVPLPSLNRVFQFNVYLPRNPRVTMQQAGLSVAPTPLYIAVSTPAGAAASPDPSVEVMPAQSGHSYLRVTLDLTTFTGTRYEKRLVVGWVLPAADNWGLGRWKLRLNRLQVSDDGDGPDGGDGDWRLWLNTNNATNDPADDGTPREWTRIINCNGCVHGTEDFGGRPWETGATGSDRNLGPDLLRYPKPGTSLIPGPVDSRILFHLSGYERDLYTDDNLGTALRQVDPVAAMHVERNYCDASIDDLGLVYSGCAYYTAYYEVVAGPPLPPASLTRGARALAEQYVLRCGPPGNGDDVGVCDEPPAVDAPLQPVPVHPDDRPLAPGSGPVLVTDTEPFRNGEREAGLTEGTIDDFYAAITAAELTDPALVARILTALRAAVDARLAESGLEGDVAADLPVIQMALPPHLWAQHFADLQGSTPSSGPATHKLTGAGEIVSPDVVRLGAVDLPCATDGASTRLVVRWGIHRFDLDGLLQASCEGGTHRGRGIGRYDGRPGAVVDWTLVDGGQDDDASVTIRTQDGGGTTVLGVSGPLTRGNLTLH